MLADNCSAVAATSSADLLILVEVFKSSAISLSSWLATLTSARALLCSTTALAISWVPLTASSLAEAMFSLPARNSLAFCASKSEFFTSLSICSLYWPKSCPIFSKPSTLSCKSFCISSKSCTVLLMSSTTASTPARISSTTPRISRADRSEVSARLRTSSATTAKPRPCSPARAASMAAFKASRLV